MSRSRPIGFITGIAGFAGSHLAELLLSKGFRVYGGLHPRERLDNIAHLKSDLELLRFDIQNTERCERAIDRIRPDYIWHLAAMASVWRSFETEQQVYRVNFEGTLNLLQAAKRDRRLKTFVFVSSADCYGIFKPKSLTLTEEQPLNPISPYALSKALAEQACRFYHTRYDLPVVIARSFAHCGPRQSADFVVAAFARQVALIEADRQQPVIRVGNLSPRRDMSDVRDIVDGYRRLALKGRPGRVYQLCSGKAVKIESILKQLLNLSQRSIKVRIDRERFRPVDVPVQRGNNERAVQEVGFVSRYTLKTTLKDTLDYWRDQVRGKHTG
ncbi:MAG TPA: GDP-mannose 4,6-dehydratase [candidate division Zixibacteria bacterium]|nr:GDP-mannose 4,6-dehydratase [candidate division Zixibacteria bacterium]